MPNVLIEIRCSYSKDVEIGLIDAVHRAMVDTLGIPHTDKDIRLVVHEPHRFACPPNLGKPACFTSISLDLFAGRTLETKKTLYQAIVANLASFGIPGDHIKILLRESNRDNWGIRGGKPSSEIDLGFQVED